MSGPELPTAPYADPLTVAAVGILAYLAANVIHEGIGHGAVCALLRGKVVHLSSVYCKCDYRGLSRNRRRAVEAGGTVANLFFGLLFFAAFTLSQSTSPVWRYFLWLSAMVNLFQAGGYLMVSPFARFGDWKDFLEGMRGRLAWKLVLTACGLLISVATLYSGLRALDAFSVADNPLRSRQAWLLTALPYFVGGLASCAIALLNRVNKMLVVTSAGASTLGGTSWLLWVGYVTGVIARQTAAEPLIIRSSPAWIVLALVVLAAWTIILGPGLTLGSGKPTRRR